MTKITMTYDFYRKENEVKHFQTEVELRSFIINFGHKKTPLFRAGLLVFILYLIKRYI